MHSSENQEIDTCVACGKDILPERDPAFGVSEEMVLCFACAISRGGVYDEAHDHWDREPDVTGLQ